MKQTLTHITTFDTPHGSFSLQGERLHLVRFASPGERPRQLRLARKPHVIASLEYGLRQDRKQILPLLEPYMYPEDDRGNPGAQLSATLQMLRKAPHTVPSGLQALICAAIWNNALVRGEDPEAVLRSAHQDNQMTGAEQIGVLQSGRLLMISQRVRDQARESLGHLITAVNPESSLLFVEGPKIPLKHADERRDVRRIMDVSFPGLRGPGLAQIHRRHGGAWMKAWWKSIRLAVASAAQVRGWNQGEQEQLCSRLFADLTRQRYSVQTVMAQARQTKNYEPEMEQLIAKIAESFSEHGEKAYRDSSALNIFLKAKETLCAQGTFRVPDLDLRYGRYGGGQVPAEALAGQMAALLCVAERPERLLDMHGGEIDFWQKLMDTNRALSEATEMSRIHGMPPALRAMISGRGAVCVPDKGTLQDLEDALGDVLETIRKRTQGTDPVPLATCQPSHPLHLRLKGLWTAAGRTRGLDASGTLGNLTLTQRLVGNTKEAADIGTSLRNCIPSYSGRAVKGDVVLLEYLDGNGKTVLDAEVETHSLQIVQLQGYGDRRSTPEERELATFLLARCGLPVHSASKDARECPLPDWLAEPVWEEWEQHVSEEQRWGQERTRSEAMMARQTQAITWLARQSIGRHAQHLAPCEINGLGVAVRLGEGNENLTLYNVWGSSQLIPALHRQYQFSSELTAVPELSAAEQRVGTLIGARPNGSAVLRLRTYGAIGINSRAVMRGDTSFLQVTSRITGKGTHAHKPVLDPLEDIDFIRMHQHTTVIPELRCSPGKQKKGIAARVIEDQRPAKALSMVWERDPERVAEHVQMLREWCLQATRELESCAVDAGTLLCRAAACNIADPGIFPTDPFRHLIATLIWNPVLGGWDNLSKWKKKAQDAAEARFSGAAPQPPTDPAELPF